MPIASTAPANAEYEPWCRPLFPRSSATPTPATANLLAAAPDLLAALIAAVQSEGPFGSDRRPEWFNAACAAIAKAEGH